MDTSAVVAIEAIIRILCDVLPDSPADAAHLFAQTPDNEDSVIRRAVALVEESKAKRIMILEAPAGNAYAGAEKWEGLLCARGLKREMIDRVPLSLPHHNTLSEAEAMVRFAHEHRCRSLIVTAPPFHQVRAFMTTVRAVQRSPLPLMLFSSPGCGLEWMQRVVHSQGALAAERRGLILEELRRIETYALKGDLIQFHEAIAYLNRRDLAGPKDLPRT